MTSFLAHGRTTTIMPCHLQKIYYEHWRAILTVRDKSRPYGQHGARQSNDPRTFEIEF